MSGFNMPPGVSPQDIPGNGPELTNIQVAIDLQSMLQFNLDTKNYPTLYPSEELYELIEALLEFKDAPHCELVIYQRACHDGFVPYISIRHQKVILEAVNEWLDRH